MPSRMAGSLNVSQPNSMFARSSAAMSQSRACHYSWARSIALPPNG